MPGGVDPDAVGAEQGRTTAQVGPALLLHVGDHDEVPLEPLGPVGREEAHRRPAHALLGERVGGQLLGDDAREERADADVVALVDRAGGQVEERDDRVEVTVGPAGARSARVDLAPQPLGPRGAGPEVPEHVLDTCALLEHPRTPAQQAREAGGPLDVGALESVEEAGLDDREPEQLAGRAPDGGVGLALLARAEAAQQRAEVGGVEPAQR